ncbi:MAG: ABC transporter permease subunit [Planctomycetes bacterium]|nr:ABC transporter permease subunit [Planctomycetota bacterium]
MAGGLLGAMTAPARALAGPILAKELRVSSRRRRNYVLRSVYLAAMTVFIGLVWIAAVQSFTGGPDNSRAYRIAQMATAGRTIVASIVWFQFAAVLIATVIMLSTSISEEIDRRTLGVLMSTPVTSLQVVGGKLAAKMLHLVMLLATSLPLLAVVRVLGGVPWDYIVSGLCITLATAVLFAAVTMFFSILFRRAFVCMLLSLLVLGAIYAALPLLASLTVIAFFGDSPDEILSAVTTVLVGYNPFASLGVRTIIFSEPRAATGMPFAFHWWTNCLVSLALAAVILGLCVLMVRRAGLKLAGATGAPGRPPKRKGPPAAAVATALGAAVRPGEATSPPPAGTPPSAPAASAPPPSAAAVPATRRRRSAGIRPVGDRPVVWRELRAGWTRRRTMLRVVIGLALLILLAVYVLAGLADMLDDFVFQVLMMAAYVIIGIVAVVVLSATPVTAEKEAGSWDILLCTPLSDGHILAGKLAGILKRSAPLWLPSLLHTLAFVLVGVFHPVLLVCLPMIIVGASAVLAGGGLYFGSRVKKTTTAVILNLALAFAMWVALPGVLALGAETMPSGRARRAVEHAVEFAVDANPVFQVGILIEASIDLWGGVFGYSHDCNWCISNMGAGKSLAYIGLWTGVYVLLGALLAWRAKCRFRRRRRSAPR